MVAMAVAMAPAGDADRPSARPATADDGGRPSPRSPVAPGAPTVADVMAVVDHGQKAGPVMHPARTSTDFGDLLDAASAGDGRAIDVLVADYRPRLSAFAARRGAADPDGIADVVLVAVIRRLDRLDFGTSREFWAYLCQAARSRIVDEHRATKPVVLIDDQEALERSRPEPIGFDDRVVDHDYVDHLLSPLTSEQRQVLQLRFLEDLSIEETASRTGRSQGAVKGLQRRAINAILAAVAVLVLLAALGALGAFGDDGRSVIVDDGPADRPEGPEVDDQRPAPPGPPEGVGTSGETVDHRAAEGADESVELPATSGAPDVAPAATDGPPAPGAGEGADAGSLHPITTGSERATELDGSGRPGPIDAHGARNYCVASHLAYDDAVPGPGGAGPVSLQLHWGNTVGGAVEPAEVPVAGRGTCEGGVSDRSAYWMPALFDGSDRVVIPELIRVEYKAFGGPGFDRSTLQPIPAGLHLVAGPEIANYGDQPATVTGGPDRLDLAIRFPSCVQVSADGRPVVAGDRPGSHLSYPTGDGDGPSNCPPSHPYRIPTLGIAVTYAVPVDSGWYLASADGTGERSVVAGAVAAWDPATMATLVACVRDLTEDCGFVGFDADGRPQYRSQLPERFADPDGRAVYRSSVALADGADRRPFDDALGPVP